MNPFIKVFVPRFFVGKKLNKKSPSQDECIPYISSAELFQHSQSQVEWFCVFLDVAPYSDFSQNVRASLNSGISSRTFSKKKIPRVFARQLFPCQTRASEASEFDKEKSAVLRVRILARPSKVRESTCRRSACTNDTRRVSCSAYLVLGYIVTPLERCRLQQVHL